MSFLPLWQRLAPWTRSRVSLWRRARKLMSNLSAYCPVGALQINFQIQKDIVSQLVEKFYGRAILPGRL